MLLFRGEGKGMGEEGVVVRVEGKGMAGRRREREGLDKVTLVDGQ